MVAEEADESVFWLELIAEMKILNPKQLDDILKEARELAAIFLLLAKQQRATGKLPNYQFTQLPNFLCLK